MRTPYFFVLRDIIPFLFLSKFRYRTPWNLPTIKAIVLSNSSSVRASSGCSLVGFWFFLLRVHRQSRLCLTPEGSWLFRYATKHAVSFCLFLLGVYILPRFRATPFLFTQTVSSSGRNFALRTSLGYTWDNPWVMLMGVSVGAIIRVELCSNYSVSDGLTMLRACNIPAKRV